MASYSSTSSDDKINDSSSIMVCTPDVTTTTTTITIPTPVPEEVESRGCRKSSRLKAKLSHQNHRQAEAAEGGEEADDASYDLRLSSLVKRVQTESRQRAPKQPKDKSKPPPLSKYRRRTANARERTRMKEINEGFERLREALPEMDPPPQTQAEKTKKEKPTKLTVLNLALNYIHALRDILGYPAVSEDGSSGSGSGVVSAHSEESDLGSDAASTRTLSTSSASCDEVCSSNPSPTSPTLLEGKGFALSDAAAFIASSGVAKDFTACLDNNNPANSLMEFMREVRSSPSSSSSSDPSLPPTPPPLPLPEECLDIDQADLLDVSIPLEWESLGDILL